MESVASMVVCVDVNFRILWVCYGHVEEHLFLGNAHQRIQDERGYVSTTYIQRFR